MIEWSCKIYEGVELKSVSKAVKRGTLSSFPRKVEQTDWDNNFETQRFNLICTKTTVLPQLSDRDSQALILNKY